MASPAPSEDKSPDVPDFNGLGLRTLRQVARFLGVAQKVDGKDRSKASFIEELEGMLKTNRDGVLEAIVAVG